LWSAVGFVLLLVAYFLFEFFTPVFRVDEEIGKDNRAVGLLSMVLSVSLSYIIGAAVI
jgi:putative membrane protein